ncbi:O-antigen ligase family protein [Vibrio rotiferianus]|uniref:O-antigen ligase family protein n=1 Tax=Vibrio rotiferianus TaxID=190895 RepID=UPI00390ABC2E
MRHKFEIILTHIIVFELVLGGTGQTFKFGFITLRQILFIIAILYFSFSVFFKSQRKIYDDFYLYLLFYFAVFWSLISAIIGVFREHDFSLVLGDLSPMLYFLMYFPFGYFVRNNEISYEKIMISICLASFVVSTICIALYVSYFLVFDRNISLVREFSNSIFGKDVIWFRLGGFVVYPGQTFVLCSQLFCFSKLLRSRSITHGLLYFIFTLTIILSMTKGFLICSLLGQFMLIFLLPRVSSHFKALAVIFIILVSFVSTKSVDFSRFYETKNDHGVQIRLQTMSDTLDKMDSVPVILFGNGFGTELPLKKAHQENSYFDIFLEQGIVGLSIYFLFILLLLTYFNRNIVLAVTLLSVFILSLTNPYVNNPLGISIIIITMVYLIRPRNELVSTGRPHER